MKKRLLFFLLVSFILVLAACSSGNDTNENDLVNENEEDIVENEPENEENTNENDETNVGEEDDDQEQNEESENTAENEAEEDRELITETGTYNGQADPHTIEIETADGPQAFQLTMEARDDIEALTEGEDVTYTYHVNGEQLVIETIEPAE